MVSVLDPVLTAGDGEAMRWLGGMVELKLSAQREVSLGETMERLGASCPSRRVTLGRSLPLSEPWFPHI